MDDAVVAEASILQASQHKMIAVHTLRWPYKNFPLIWLGVLNMIIGPVLNERCLCRHGHDDLKSPFFGTPMK